MKDLNEYLNNFDSIDKILIKHAEFGYAANACGIRWRPYYTFESLGIFNGCKELVNDIVEKYKPGMDSIILNCADCEFTDKIEICFKKQKGEKEYDGYYMGDEKYPSRWDEDKQKFKYIKIEIYNINPDDYLEEPLKMTLAHEFIHAHDDWILHKDGTSLYNKYKTYNHKEEFVKIVSRIRDDITSLKKYEHRVVQDLHNTDLIIYFLNNYEIHSFIGSINEKIKGKEFDTTEEFVNFLNKEVKEYGIYKNIYYILRKKDFEEALIDYGFKKSTINILKKKSSKVLQKMINHISNMMWLYRDLHLTEHYHIHGEIILDIFKR